MLALSVLLHQASPFDEESRFLIHKIRTKMSRSNGRLEPEVIVNVRDPFFVPQHRYIRSIQQYADGYAYSKHKMEEAFRPGGFLEKPPAKSPHTLTKDPALPPLKREDVDIIVCPSEIKWHESNFLLCFPCRFRSTNSKSLVRKRRKFSPKTVEI